MSLNKEAVRLAYLSKANKRADERMLNVSEKEAQAGTAYSGGFGRRRGRTSRASRKISAIGHDAIIENAPELMEKFGVPKGIVDVAKGVRGAKRAITGRGKTGGSHKNRYDVEEDIHITTGGERLKRVKGRGMKRKVGGNRKGAMKKLAEADLEDLGSDSEMEMMEEEASVPARARRTREGARSSPDTPSPEPKAKRVKRRPFKGGAKARKSAEEMGKMYGKEVVAMDGDVKELVGSGFFEDFGRGFMKGLRMVSGVAKNVLPVVAPGVGSLASAGLELAGLGNKREYRKGGAGLQDDLAYTEAVNMNRTRSGGSAKPKRKQSDKMKKRNALVRKLMREKGMSLPQASKYIKEHNLM